MNELAEAFKTLTSLGTVPQWGTFVIISLALIRMWPQMREMDYSEASKLRKELREMHGHLRKCEEECDIKCDKLQDEIYGMKAQRLQEQLAMLSAFPSQLMTPAMMEMLDRLNLQQRDLQEPKNHE